MIQLLHKHGFVYDQLPAILWALIIFISSSIPSLTLPEFKAFSSDKVAHFLVYIVLCVLLYRALAFQTRFPMLAKWSLLSCFIFAVAYGALDEFHQSFVPNRDASTLDLAADTVGAFLFVAYKLLKSRTKRIATKPD